MQKYLKFYLIWSTFSILLLVGGFGWQTVKSGNLQQSLEQSQKETAALDQALMDTEKKLNTSKAQITTLQGNVETLQQKSNELQEQIILKDKEIKKLESLPPKVIYKTTEAKKVSTMPSRGTPSKGREIIVSSTAYTAYCNGCSGLTRWNELNLRENPGLKVIAVDPNVIPLGSKVYVEGYGYAIAADTGGAIKGYKIDVFIPNQSDALAWGRKTITVKVLES